MQHNPAAPGIPIAAAESASFSSGPSVDDDDDPGAGLVRSRPVFFLSVALGCSSPLSSYDLISGDLVISLVVPIIFRFSPAAHVIPLAFRTTTRSAACFLPNHIFPSLPNRWFTFSTRATARQRCSNGGSEPRW